MMHIYVRPRLCPSDFLCAILYKDTATFHYFTRGTCYCGNCSQENLGGIVMSLAQITMKFLHKLSRDTRSILHLNRPKEVAVLTRLMELGTEHHLLDVGCGDGYLTTRFAKTACFVVGIDPDARMLGAARRLHAKPNIKFDEGTAEKLPYPNVTFDRVVAVSVVEHFHDPAAGLKEMARVLKPGGILAISVDSLLPENSPESFRQWHASRYRVTTYFRLEQILDILRDAGLNPDTQSLQGIHVSKCASALRRCYMRHKVWCFPAFPLFLGACRLSDRIGLGGRVPPQILILRALKPQSANE